MMPAVAMALVKVAPVPGRKAMPSPTMATTLWSYSVVIEAMRPRSSSRSKTASRASVAACVRVEGKGEGWGEGWGWDRGWGLGVRVRVYLGVIGVDDDADGRLSRGLGVREGRG